MNSTALDDQCTAAAQEALLTVANTTAALDGTLEPHPDPTEVQVARQLAAANPDLCTHTSSGPTVLSWTPGQPDIGCATCNLTHRADSPTTCAGCGLDLPETCGHTISLIGPVIVWYQTCPPCRTTEGDEQTEADFEAAARDVTANLRRRWSR
ncbi:hypothetical protein [Nocardioides sp. GY 10127]|uniref:hypothetical protein n=1 Tax=Nocardioides sp. GY 10127 TaxID=2569762 RepID=UPI0010A91616|nr:hypothetical protein [Nocardioides sp. GY 10127]TIC84109.1 hypothetical protein E8D37_04690 [Nocardioides sp. GY 10127]